MSDTTVETIRKLRGLPLADLTSFAVSRTAKAKRVTAQADLLKNQAQQATNEATVANNLIMGLTLYEVSGRVDHYHGSPYNHTTQVWARTPDEAKAIARRDIDWINSVEEVA